MGLLSQPLTRWLTDNPQFEISRIIVGADAILVMDRFGWEKRPTDETFHYYPVFQHVAIHNPNLSITVRG